MKRLLLFARSVIPVDPSQLLLLTGSILLFICMQLRCFPVIPDYSWDSFAVAAYQAWLLFSIEARNPIVFAGVAGLFICFWPGTHPVRRTLIFVMLPALAGITALSAHFIYMEQYSDFPRTSVMQGGPHNEGWVLGNVWSLGPALHMSVIGFGLVFLFYLRLATGVSSLPISVTHAGDELHTQDEVWRRIFAFVWISIVGISVIGAVAAGSLWGVYALIGKFVSRSLLPPIIPLASALTTACLAGIAAWAVGKDRWKELRRFTRFPEEKFVVLGMTIPIAILLMPNLAAYLFDRVHWAALEYGKFAPPVFTSYFQFPNLVFFWYLIAAGFEEIIWRGYLQPRFVQRYGLMRGIFLLGVAWSAFHFLGDFQKTTDDYQVLITFIIRLSSCIPLGYVLGWLTLRSGSIWPAALVHGLNNVLAYSDAHLLEGRQSPVVSILTVCWGLLAFVLFRFWPPSIATEDSDQGTEIGTEPTV